MRLTRFLAVLAAAFLASRGGFAYTPGSGTLFTESFNAAIDADWEQPNGVPPNPSPWTQVVDGADKVFYADGIGPFGFSPTRHWARHFVQPVQATTFSVAFEYRAELGAGYLFDLEVEQRATVLRRYRVRVDGNGAVSLWRTQAGTFTQLAATGNGTIPVNQKRWIRFAIEPDASAHPRVRVRVWNGGATAETSSWNLDFLDTLDTLQRVHRFELSADGPKGIETWIDDLDVFGDSAAGAASSITKIFVMEASHLDIGFTDPPDVVEAFEKSHLDQVLANLDADPAYRWFIEEAWDLDRWWERSSDAERQNMVAHLQSGRLRLGAGYASLHTTAAGHEELTRNLYWASRFAREHQVPLRTWITDDVPGSSFALPEMLARSGIEYFVGGMNCGFGGKVDAPNHGTRPFWWVGPDGSKVLSWITFDAYAEGFDWGFSFFDTIAEMYKKVGKKLPEQEEAGYPYPEMLLMRAFDNHYQGFHTRDLVNQWNATYQNPKFVLATPEEFFDMMIAKYGANSFPSYSGDFGAAWSGSHANAQHTEEMVRQSHREGRTAEALLAAAWAIDGAPAPRAEADWMYRNMLQVDEHSGAGGWPGYFTPAEMDSNNRQHLAYAVNARDTARSLLGQGLDRALAQLSASGDAVAVVNPLGRSRDGYAKIALTPALYGSSFKVVDRGTGVEIAYQRFDASSEILFLAAVVPAFGYRVYDLVPGTPTAAPSGLLTVTATTLENDFYRLSVDPADGSLTSLYDKARGKEMIDATSAYDFNELASAVKQQMDGAQAPTAQNPASASASVRWSGPLVASIRVTRAGTPHVETTYRLYRNEDRVEFENVLDETLMPHVSNATAVRAYTVTLPFDIRNFQIRSESTTRFVNPLADGFPRASVFDWHNVEHTLAFFDGNKGALYACDAVDAHSFERFSTLPPAAFDTGKAVVLSRLKDKSDEYQFEDGSVGSYEIEPGTSGTYRYTHHVRATPPLFDPVAASRFGFEALNPLQTRLLSHRPGNLPADAASFFRTEAPGVLIYTVKAADDGDGVVLRMTELTGVATTALVTSGALALTAPERIRQDEGASLGPLAPDGNGFLVPLQAYETATVRVRAAPGWPPITLLADKNAVAGAIGLSWTGGTAPYTLERAEDPAFTVGVVAVVDEQAASRFDDPILSDGRTYYYRVK